MRRIIITLALFGMGLSTSGCVIAAAAGAGYMLHDEATECDDEFDPLEEVLGNADGCN